ncbi:Plasma membrane proteolipid 3 [Leucoagaricus sp. SymC.cos]|nr:Plasma membrane proteolipid 3 [Leucoagaricus sp. SymC.cos]
MVKASDVVLIIVAIIFPPAAAFIITGCGCDLLINILLTILGYLPGHIHAFWLIYKKMQAEERYGMGGFHYVGAGHYEPLYQSGPPSHQGHYSHSPMPPPQPQAPQYYGATGQY